TSEESAKETDDADDSDMDLSHDNPKGDNDTTRYGKFMYNKSTEMPKSTYFSPTITSSSLDFIQNLLDETHVNELTDLMSNPVYTDAHTTSAVHNPEGNPKVRSFLSGASEVPFATHVDVQATNLVLQEMFSDDAAHHMSSPPSTTTHKLPINPQPNSLQAKAKKLMQKAKKNMRKINFKKAVAQKFREYDQKLEALTNFNVSEAFEIVVQAKVPTKIKKLLPTHIPTAVANYVRPRLNTFELEEALNAQDTEPPFHKRSHDNQDPPNDHKGEKRKKQRKKQRKDVGQSSSRSSRRKKSLVCEETHHYLFEALNGIHHWEDSRIDFFKVQIIRRSDDNEYEFSYADLSRLSLYDVKDITSSVRATKRLKRRDWTDDDVVKSNEMVKKIDQTLKRREQLRRLEEYVGGRPKTINPYEGDNWLLYDHQRLATRHYAAAIKAASQCRTLAQAAATVAAADCVCMRGLNVRGVGVGCYPTSNRFGRYGAANDKVQPR
ncbi:hypothetical protein Tco_1515040, partial [Tanacetum coccineum]